MIAGGFQFIANFLMQLDELLRNERGNFIALLTRRDEGKELSRASTIGFFSVRATEVGKIAWMKMLADL